MAAVLSAVQPQYSDAPGRARAYGFDHAAAGDLRLDGRRGRASAAAEKGRPRVPPETTSESHAPDPTATTRASPLPAMTTKISSKHPRPSPSITTYDSSRPQNSLTPPSPPALPQRRPPPPP